MLFAHVWFHGMGVTGLGVQQNNISWIFVSIVISLSLFVVYKRKNLTLPKNWKWLVLGLGLMLIPFLFGEKRFVTDISSSLLVFGTLGVGGSF